MKILIIDSHKGTKEGIPQNLHWQNSKVLADHLGADLIWSYPTVNDEVKSGYEVIIFVHASPYAYTDYKWLQESPNAKLYLITNEYNLGEPRTLWMAAKEGRKYTVLANHPHEPSKIVMKYVDDWIILNLNALVYKPVSIAAKIPYTLFDDVRGGCIYYGSFRKDRSEYFAKYLTSDVTLSTHTKNIEKFRAAGATSSVIPRIAWSPKGRGIADYALSLYLEDKKTHLYYNHLANRFYEALNYNCTPIFTAECENTLCLSGYFIGSEYIVDDPSNIKSKEGLPVLPQWHALAEFERCEVLQQIKTIIYEKNN
jgi:hypothetical protein